MTAHELEAFRAFLDAWHEFYLMTGTAAVTLAGLLFVALSLHLEVLVQERFKALLVVARATLGTFVTVLIVSLMLLVPMLTPRVAGLTVTAFVLVFALIMLRDLRGALRHDHEDFSRALVRRRLVVPIVGYLVMAVVGISVMLRMPEMLFLMVSVMCGLLANAVWASWDLLVRVARARERMKTGA